MRSLPSWQNTSESVTPEEFQAFYPQVVGWIHRTLEAYEKNAKSIASVGFARLPLYFSHELLRHAKFVAVDRPPMPPLSALGLTQFVSFERGDYDGVTYFDTLFLKRERVAVGFTGLSHLDRMCR
jgi:hypothetical protein